MEQGMCYAEEMELYGEDNGELIKGRDQICILKIKVCLSPLPVVGIDHVTLEPQSPDLFGHLVPVSVSLLAELALSHLQLRGLHTPLEPPGSGGNWGSLLPAHTGRPSPAHSS